jgi:hypothetical protein
VLLNYDEGVTIQCMMAIINIKIINIKIVQLSDQERSIHLIVSYS